MNFVRFVVLPLGYFGTLVAALALGMWTVAAIAGILLVYFLIIVRREYGGRERLAQKPWLDRMIEAWREPSGVGLMAAGSAILAAAIGFGLTIGVLASIGIWIVLLGLWVAARLRHRTPRRE